MKFDQDLCLKLLELCFKQNSTLGSVVSLAMFKYLLVTRTMYVLYPVNCFIQLLIQSSVIADHINSSHPPILPTGEEVKAEVSTNNCNFRSAGVQKYCAGNTYQKTNKAPILPTGEEVKIEVSKYNCGFRLDRGPQNILRVILTNK